MKNVLRTALIIASVAIMAFSAVIYFRTGQATAEGELVGFVDSDEIVAGYAPARQAQEAWDSFEQKHDQELQQKIFKKYNTVNLDSLTDAQKAEVQQLLEQADAELKAQFENIRKQQWDPARAKIQSSIDTVAKDKGVRVVLEKKVVLSGGLDMTQDVLGKLK